MAILRTAVIGHGRSPEGKGWGKEIDTCFNVIRMFDWQWQEPADYGTKFDYGLYALYPRGLEAFWKWYEQHDHAKPTLAWLTYWLKETEGELPEPRILIDHKPWVNAAMKMGGVGMLNKLNLTRGTAAACWAIANAPVFSQVVLVGFDNVRRQVNLPWNDAFSPAYSEVYYSHFKHNRDKVYAEWATKTQTHDMVVERPLLFELAATAAVSLQFAEDVWPTNR